MSNVYQKQLTAKAIDPFLINFIMYLGLTICCIPIIIRTTFLTFPHQIWSNAILGGMCGALGNSYLVKALKMESFQFWDQSMRINLSLR